MDELDDIGTRLDLFARRPPAWRHRIGHLRAAFDALWALTKRNVSEAAQTGVPGIGGSVFKLSFSEHAQALGDLAMEMLDTAALCADPLTRDGAPIGNAEQVHNWFKSINLTIAAGTSQVQRNIVAERILGLPEDALMDFRVGEAERELAEGIRTMLAGRLPLERIRAREGEERTISAEDWAALGETGVFALTLPEPAGTGLGLADAAVVFEELGRALVPGPLVGTFLAATSGPRPGAAEGRALVGLCTWRRRTTLVGGAPRRRSTPRSCSRRRRSARAAALLPTIRAGADGAARRRAARPAHAALAAAELPAGRSVDDPEARLFARRRHPHGRAAGGPRGRVPRPRGGLRQGAAPVRQAHRQLPGGQAHVRRHAGASRGGPGRRPRRRPAWPTRPTSSPRRQRRPAPRPVAWMRRAAAGAKLLADEAAIANARTAIQVHGGMGYTWEVPLHLHLKRSRVLATTFGTAAALSSLVGSRRPRPPERA